MAIDDALAVLVGLAGEMTHIVMFDVDGTLVDSAGFDGNLYAEAVRAVLGVDVDETWASYANVTDSGVLEQILAEREFERPLEELRSRSRVVSSS